MSLHPLGTIEESGLSDAQPTPSPTNASTSDLNEAINHTQIDEDDEDESFQYPGAEESTNNQEETSATPSAPAPPPRDPAQLEEIYSAAVSGDLYQLQTLFQAALSSSNGTTEPFSLANDATTRTGLTPLHAAASRGHLEVVQWLVERCGAMADLEDREGETALHKASLNGHLPVIEYLLYKDVADVHAQDADGWTPLHNACSKGYLDIVRYLCHHGAAQAIEVNGIITNGVDRRSNGGWTPLMNAASKGHLPVVLFLLSKQHADPLIRNNWGETAYDIAAAVFEVWICEVLQKAEAERWDHSSSRYDPLAVHTTVPLILHENQRLDARLKTLAVSGGRPRFSTSGLGRNGRHAPFELRLPDGEDATGKRDIPAWRSDVQLPLLEDPFTLPKPKASREPNSRRVIGERSHFWLSDWTLDLTHPRVDANDGWQYARTFDDPDEQWLAEVPLALERVLSGAGVLAPALAGGSMGGDSHPITMALDSRRASVSQEAIIATSWVRRRRWIRVLRRRLDISPLSFLQPDGFRYFLGAEGSLIPAHEEQYEQDREMGVVNARGQDYVSRARYLAGTQRQGSTSIGLIEIEGTGANEDVVSVADLKRAIGRLDRATLELRAGMLGDGDNERKTQAEVLLNVYNRELERLKLSAQARGILIESRVEDYVEDDDSDSDESFHYPTASSPTSTARPSSIRSRATSMDYFNFGATAYPAGASSSSRRATDLTPQLSQAPDFRVPTHEVPQKVSTPRWTAPTPHSVHVAWERDEVAHECRSCQRKFTFWLRKHCRRCGKIFCDRCSSKQALLDPADVVQDPNYSELFGLNAGSHRVCDPCYETVTANVPSPLQGGSSHFGSLERIVIESNALLSVPRSRQNSSSQLSDLAECPVCGESLADLGTPAMQEAHVKSCLDGPSGGISQAGKYLVYKLPAESALIGVECVICLEEFVTGTDVARLSCFCTFHNWCLSAWLGRGRACPVHARDT